MQRRLLAADVGAGAHLDADVEVEARLAADVASPSSPCGRAARRARCSRYGAQVGVLAAQVEDALAGADRVAGDGHALEQQVGRSVRMTRSLKVPGSPSSALQTT